MQAKVSDPVLGKDKLVERSEYEKLKHYVLELEDHLAEVQQQSMKLVKWQQHPTASHSLLSILQHIYLDLVFFAGFLMLMYIYTQNHHQCMWLIWVQVITLIISVPGLLFLQSWGGFVWLWKVCETSWLL
jgi:hypothetical protein